VCLPIQKASALQGRGDHFRQRERLSTWWKLKMSGELNNKIIGFAAAQHKKNHDEWQSISRQKTTQENTPLLWQSTTPHF